MESRRDPTPREIQLACERIRASWTAAEKVQRKARGDGGRVAWRPMLLVNVTTDRQQMFAVTQEA